MPTGGAGAGATGVTSATGATGASATGATGAGTGATGAGALSDHLQAGAGRSGVAWPSATIPARVKRLSWDDAQVSISYIFVRLRQKEGYVLSDTGCFKIIKIKVTDLCFQILFFSKPIEWESK